ncbi:endonuclease III [Pacificimonas sp. WHA3]|uniref:Endonuclease III n=1 Tax=Pacificimonas pallii TaxID=2827236 RepID=A0ABS6SBH3_9SPHN|nr:endonuclease III [Pacificimonas pallii]MBV7255438.1 endonuclease III [Pacificimonas pallii]
MQLGLGLDDNAAKLRDIHARLIARFGRHARPLGTRFDPEAQLVQGVIGARTKTAVSNRSTRAMLAHYGSWLAVSRAPLTELKGFLETATFPDIAATRLKAALTAIVDQRGDVDLSHLRDMSVADAMAWLETLPGIARKISAGVMNASTMNRPAMVIDSHHRRVLQRLGLVSRSADTRRAYDAIVPAQPDDWSAMDMDEHHMLMKRLGQTYCRPKSPDCARCPLAGICGKVGVEPAGGISVH